MNARRQRSVLTVARTLVQSLPSECIWTDTQVAFLVQFVQRCFITNQPLKGTWTSTMVYFSHTYVRSVAETFQLKRLSKSTWLNTRRSDYLSVTSVMWIIKEGVRWDTTLELSTQISDHSSVVFAVRHLVLTPHDEAHRSPAICLFQMWQKFYAE